jgi:predicted enzyme related to lactoylglutathione lyase
VPPKLTAVCIITEDVARLRAFYEAVLEVTGEGDDHYSYFATATFQLSIFSTSGMESMAPGSTRGSGTGRCVLEAEVEDVDAEHRRLLALGVAIVKPPANYDWGLRSVWFRDPDGNVVDFFAPVRG